MAGLLPMQEVDRGAEPMLVAATDPGAENGSYWGPTGWGPPPPYAQGAQLPASAAPVQTEAKAVVALVLAIGSFFVLPLLPAIVALVLARSSQRDIDAAGGRLTGTGLLTAARIVSWINIGLCVLVVVLIALGIGLLTSTGFS